MSKTLTKARGRQADPDGRNPAAEVKTALAGFMGDIKTFHDDIHSRLQQQEERLTMLDRKSHTLSRPALAASDHAGAPHQKAFESYLRSGDDAELRGLELDTKAMSSQVASDGGYLVDPETAASIQSVMDSTASIRAVANVVQVEASAYDVLIDQNDLGSGWADEVTDTAESTTPTIDRISIPLHELAALPKISQRLLDDSAFDVETWLAGRIAERFARAESGAFITGDGLDKPTGILTHPIVDNSLWSWGEIGYVATGVSGDFDTTAPGDAIIDLVYALGADYRANGTFVMNSRTAGSVRKMKDLDGRFLWSDGLAAGEPARLMGYPVLIAEDMPDIGIDSHAIAFGDFSAGYTVAERPDTRILRDPFSAKPHVLFYATRRVGGDVSDFAAIKLLRFSVA